MKLRDAAKIARKKPWMVERHDNENGSIAWEIWTTDMTQRICRMVDDDNPEARSYAYHLVDLHNATLSSQHHSTEAG